MITAKQILKLDETWYKNISSSYSKSVPIYVNPDSTDLKELYQSTQKSHNDNIIRFIAEAKTQQVFVWDGNLALHTDVNINGTSFTKLYGYGILHSGKITYYKRHEDSNPTAAIDYLFATFKGNFSVDYYKHLLNDRYVQNDYRDLTEMFSYNWSFLDRYIQGANEFIQKEKARFDYWVKKYIK